MIVPETGDTILILGSFLLKKTGSPAFTISPSLTESFGINPKKSSGFSAYVEEEILLEIILSADPFKFSLAPLRVRIPFFIFIKLFNSKNHANLLINTLFSEAKP